MNTAIRLQSRRPLREWLTTAVLFLLAVFASHAQSAQPCIYVGDLTFGSFIVSADAAKKLALTISNQGTDVLNFTAPYLTWPDPNFTVDPADMTALQTLVLKPNESFTIHVAFTPPTLPGGYGVIARFHTNATCDRDTSIWSALVVKPGPAVTSYDWQERWLTASDSCTRNKATGYPGSIYLSNVGNVDVTVVSVKLIDPPGSTDASNGYFTLDSTGGSGTYIRMGDVVALRSGGQLMQRVLFKPDQERTYHGRLRMVTQSGSTLDTVDAELLGYGVESHLAATPPLFDTVAFMGAWPATPSQARVVVVRALPTRSTTITGVAIAGLDADEFVVVPGGIFPKTLKPGDSLDVPVELRPRRCGPAHATVEVLGNQSECDASGTLDAVVACASGVALEERNAMPALHVVRDGERFTIDVAAATTTRARVDIVAVNGEHVATLFDDEAKPGSNRFVWDATGRAGGVYFCRVIMRGTTTTAPFVLAR